MGAVIAHSLSDALAAAEGDDEVFIIGGAEIYRQAINSIDRIYLTDVAANVSGDARFPEFDRSDWSIVEQSAHPADDRNDHPHTFTVLERIR